MLITLIWQYSYVNNAMLAEQSMTILFVEDILLDVKLRITLFSNLLCEHGIYICQNMFMNLREWASPVISFY